MLRGGTIHPISGPVIEGGSVLIRDGKIVAVGKTITPPEGYKIIDIEGQQVYPGMIDAASMLGLGGRRRQRRHAGGRAAEPPPARDHGGKSRKRADPVHPRQRRHQRHHDAAGGAALRADVADPPGRVDERQDGGERAGGRASALSGAGDAKLPPHEHDDADDDPSHVEEIPYEEAKADYDRKMKALERSSTRRSSTRAPRPPDAGLEAGFAAGGDGPGAGAADAAVRDGRAGARDP